MAQAQKIAMTISNDASIAELIECGSTVEGICAKFCALKIGWLSLAPGFSIRMPLIGYFEGLDSERGIAGRVADSLALRDFLGLALTDAVPGHSTV